MATKQVLQQQTVHNQQHNSYTTTTTTIKQNEATNVYGTIDQIFNQQKQ